MKKLLSLLAILGLAGFVIAPIYAQDVEEDINVNDESIVADVEDVVAEDVVAEDYAVSDEDYAVSDEDYAVSDEDYAVSDENYVVSDEDYAVDLENIENFNDIFENEDVKAAIDEAGLTNEEAAGLLGGFAGLFAGLGMVGIIVAIVWAILAIIALWKVFTKAGEAGLKAIIPIYNAYIMYKIAGMKNWFWYTIIAAFVGGIIAGLLGEESSAGGIVTLIASLFSGIVAIVATYKLPRKFGWGVFASVLYVLFTGICILILGFGNYKYEGKSEETIVEA